MVAAFRGLVLIQTEGPGGQAYLHPQELVSSGSCCNIARGIKPWNSSMIGSQFLSSLQLQKEPWPSQHCKAEGGWTGNDVVRCMQSGRGLSIDVSCALECSGLMAFAPRRLAKTKHPTIWLLNYAPVAPCWKRLRIATLENGRIVSMLLGLDPASCRETCRALVKKSDTKDY